MGEEVGATLRRRVASRAGYRCEYCLMPEHLLLAGCEVDHVISRKHGGVSDPANLALSCERCNRAKGTDVGSVVGAPGQFVRLFNPRIDTWSEHFCLRGARVEPLTEIGQATVRVLRLNAADRVLQRQALQEVGLYPTDVTRRES